MAPDLLLHLGLDPRLRPGLLHRLPLPREGRGGPGVAAPARLLGHRLGPLQLRDVPPRGGDLPDRRGRALVPAVPQARLVRPLLRGPDGGAPGRLDRPDGEPGPAPRGRSPVRRLHGADGRRGARRHAPSGAVRLLPGLQRLALVPVPRPDVPDPPAGQRLRGRRLRPRAADGPARPLLQVLRLEPPPDDGRNAPDPPPDGPPEAPGRAELLRRRPVVPPRPLRPRPRPLLLRKRLPAEVTAVSRPRLQRAAALGAAALLLGALLAPDAGAATKKKKRRKAPTPTAVPRPPDPFKVTFPTSDGVTLAGTFRPSPAGQGAPAVLLLHDFSRERREWADLLPAWAEKGLAALAIDLRGHGESTRRAVGGSVKLVPRLLSDPNGFPRDVEAACAWLRARAPRVGVVGLSAGGNLAVLAAARGWADAAVAVSANAEKLADLSGGTLPEPRSTLLVAAVEDPGREASARALDAAGREPKRLVLVPGAAHNLAVFEQHPDTRAAALDWIAERLGAVPPPAAEPAPGADAPAAP
ncbi:hypothetical protein FBQ97_07275 [Acidobacteria bacterium ACD]|nr:hypothetical protein [Acidobacteria bacterium ACD]